MRRRMLVLLMAASFVFSQETFGVKAAAMDLDHALNVETSCEVCDRGNGSGVDDPMLFEKEYIVIVPTVSMRSGPGYGYSIVGTLYQGDYVMVKSITDGWAKFKVSGVWRYVPASSLERTE